MLPAERAAQLAKLKVNATKTLAPNGENLANVLLWLQTRDGDSWHRVRESVEYVVPDLGKILAKAEGGRVEAVAALPDGTDRSLSQLGSGVAQFLMVAIACETQEAGAFVVLDEPEIGLHPGSQRRMVEKLRQWAKRSQIIVVTHSPFLISNRRPEDRLHWVRPGTAGSTVTRIDSSLSELLEELGVRALELLERERVLLVEGKTEELVLPVLFPEIPKSVSIVPVEGSTKLKAAHRNAKLLLGDGVKGVWQLIDRDEHTDDWEMKETKSGTTHVLGVRELENLFLYYPEAISTVLGTPITEDDLKTIADGLKEKKIANQAKAQLGEKLKPAIQKLRLDGVNSRDKAREALKSAVEQIGAISVDDTWNEVEVKVNTEWDERWRELVVGSELLKKLWDEKDPKKQGYGNKPGQSPAIAAAIRSGLDAGQLTRENCPPLDNLKTFIDSVQSGEVPVAPGSAPDA